MECEVENEIKELLQRLSDPLFFDRLKISESGDFDIMQGFLKTMLVNSLIQKGCRVEMVIGDSLQNDGEKAGDWKQVEIDERYIIEVFRAMGMTADRVHFSLGSANSKLRSSEYQKIVQDISQTFGFSKLQSCCQTMFDKHLEKCSETTQMIVICMNCADIVFLKADIIQGKTMPNVLAQEYCSCKGMKQPIIISHPKSPESSIFPLEYEEAAVYSKIWNSYCPRMKVAGNPCMDYLKHIVFPFSGEIDICCKFDKAIKTYTTLDKFACDYESNAFTTGDFKRSLATKLTKVLKACLLFDWEKYKIFLPVKLQSADLCWCYAVIDYLETRYFQLTGDRVQLSKQELIDNCGEGVDIGAEYGFSVYKALDWIKMHGISLEKNYKPLNGTKDGSDPKIDSTPIMKLDEVLLIKYDEVIDNLLEQPLIANLMVDCNEGDSLEQPSYYTVSTKKKKKKQLRSFSCP